MHFVKLAAVAAIGLVALAGCDRKPSGSQPGKTYDLTPESNARFVADFAAGKDVHKTADGLLYRVVKAGTGATAQSPADTATVTYKGSRIDGLVFDQTDPGQPRSFPIGRLIPGWVEALSMMKEGDEWELVIPANLGYGDAGAGDQIPPNQTLVFDMTLLKVQKTQ